MQYTHNLPQSCLVLVAFTTRLQIHCNRVRSCLFRLAIILIKLQQSNICIWAKGIIRMKRRDRHNKKKTTSHKPSDTKMNIARKLALRKKGDGDGVVRASLSTVHGFQLCAQWLFQGRNRIPFTASSKTPNSSFFMRMSCMIVCSHHRNERRHRCGQQPSKQIKSI